MFRRWTDAKSNDFTGGFLLFACLAATGLYVGEWEFSLIMAGAAEASLLPLQIELLRDKWLTI